MLASLEILKSIFLQKLLHYLLLLTFPSQPLTFFWGLAFCNFLVITSVCFSFYDLICASLYIYIFFYRQSNLLLSQSVIYTRPQSFFMDLVFVDLLLQCNIVGGFVGQFEFLV